MWVRDVVRLVMILMVSALLAGQEAQFPPGMQRVRLPLIMLSGGNHPGLPCIEAQLSGRTVLCMLDTGYNGMAIDGKVAKAIGLERRGSDLVFGVAGSTRVGMYRGATLNLGGIEFEVGPAHGLELDGFCAKRMRRIDALLGAPFFSGVLVTIDFAAGSVVLRDPEEFAAPAGAVGIPLKFSLGQPEVRASIDDGRSLRYMVDTGAEMTLLLHAPFVARHGFAMRAERYPETVMSGIAGMMSARMARLERFSFGGVDVESVPVTMLLPADGIGLGGDQRRVGTIGSGMMANLRVTFDYAGKRLWIESPQGKCKPARSTGLVVTSEPDGARRIGFQLAVPGRTAPDLLLEDRVVKIDGENVPENARTIYDRLRAQPETVLTVERAGKQHDVVWRRLPELPRAKAEPAKR